MSKAYVDAERCKGCGLCIANCGKKAIEMTKEINTRGYRHVKVLEELCVGYGICYVVCPDGVFTVDEKEEV